MSLGKMLRQYTIAAAVLSIVLIALYQWWFQAPWMIIGIYTAVALIALISVPLMYRWGGFFVEDQSTYLKDLEEREHKELSERLDTIKKELKTLDLKDGLRQADTLSGILNDYHSVVNTRFIGKKYSPMNYISAARSVQKHALQNLTDMVAIGHSMSSINRNKLAPELIDNPNKEQRQSKQANLYQDQESRMQDLLEENSEMFNALLETAVEVANIPSFSQFEKIDNLSRLVALAEIANNTGK